MNRDDFVRARVGEITGDAARDSDIVDELAQHMATRFTPRESATSARVAMVNQSSLRLFGFADNPVGEALRVGDPVNSEAYEIVGLVPDMKYSSLREPPRPIVFLPVDPAGDPRPFTDFMVRSALPPGQLQSAVRQALASRSP